jgi:hypothetical protein
MNSQSVACALSCHGHSCWADCPPGHAADPQLCGLTQTVVRRTLRLAASEKLRKIHNSIYTSNPTEPLERIGLRYALKIVGHLFQARCYRKNGEGNASLAYDGAKPGPGFVILT